MYYRFFGCVFVFLFLTSCAPSKVSEFNITIPDKRAPLPSMSVAEEAMFKARGGGPHLGLAMSGGGIRSAMFQVGVLRALSENSAASETVNLSGLDAISAVSGGGYAAYWLFLNEYLKGENQDFGEYTFSDERFIDELCTLTSLSNFVTYRRLALSWMLRRSTPREYYENGILRSFGEKEKSNEERLLLSSLRDNTRSGKLPYLILNGTIRGVDDPYVSEFSRYEFTPLHYGNQYGYSDWTSNTEISINQASMISGAAVGGLLYRERPAPRTDIYSNPVEVSDGGHSENLGAAALVARGANSIIISDAEFDHDLSFGSLEKLANRIAKWGYTFDFGEVVDSLRKSHGVGSFKLKHGTKPEIEVHYIKMMYDENIKNVSDLHLGMDESKARSVTNNLIDAFKQNKSSGKGYCFNATSKFREVAEGYSIDDWLIGVTHDYAHFLNESESFQSKLLRAKLRLLKMVVPGSDFMSYRFPHMTTADQSLFVDQSLALTGLGYLQGKLLLQGLGEK